MVLCERQINPYETIVKSDVIYLDTSALIKINKEEGNSSNFMRLLIYGSTINFYASWIAFGEFIGIFGKRDLQRKIGQGNYLYYCRSLMKDFDIDKIRRTEPPDDSFQFFKISSEILSRHTKLGGGDIWHLITVVELQKSFPSALLLSYDKKLVKAAGLEKIMAVNGNHLLPEMLIIQLQNNNKWIANTG
jgi:hypothetical protein